MQADMNGSGSVAARVAFDRIRYANCWEDSSLLVEALKPETGKRILSIASAGDNSLHLLAHGAEVVAADLNLTQLACVALRVAAIRHLQDQEALAFLGFYPHPDRLSVFKGLKDLLSETAWRFWDAHPHVIAKGAIHGGRFEHYFRLFRTRLVPLVHRQHKVQALLEPRSREDRERFYEQQWNNRRWRMMFRLFFSRFMMGRLGRDPEFFRYVEGSVADRILARGRTALTELDPSANPYLRYIMTGGFSGAMPDWTRPDMLAGIRQYADRLILFHGGVEAAGAVHGKEGFDGFNLSDIFEYMDEETAARLYGMLLDVARPGGRLAYWNMLVPRSCPAVYLDRVSPLKEMADRLFATDRAFFYRAFHVDEVRRQ